MYYYCLLTDVSILAVRSLSMRSLTSCLDTATAGVIIVRLSCIEDLTDFSNSFYISSNHWYVFIINYMYISVTYNDILDTEMLSL